MKPVQHATISAVFAAILYMLFRSWGMAAAAFISGVVIDLDYLLDYVVQNGYPASLDDIRRSYEGQRDLWIRVFHGWEWVILLAYSAWASGWNDWITGILAGVVLHIFLDNINWRENVRCYSLLWRWRKGFRHEAIFRKCTEKFRP